MNLKSLSLLSNQISNIELSADRRICATNNYLLELIRSGQGMDASSLPEIADHVSKNVHENFLTVCNDLSEPNLLRRYALEKGSHSILQVCHMIYRARQADLTTNKGLGSNFVSSVNNFKNIAALFKFEDMMESYIKIAENESDDPEVRKDAITGFNRLFTASKAAGVEIDRTDYNERYAVISSLTKNDWVARYAMEFGMGR